MRVSGTTTQIPSSMNTPAIPSVVPQLSDPSGWVDLYGDYLYNYALMRLKDAPMAEDAVQETFLAALKARQTFAGRSSEKTWMVGILKHKIIDQFRKNKRESTYTEESLPFEREGLFLEDGEWAGHWKPQCKPTAWGDTPLTTIEQQEFWKVFQHCFDKLPDRLASVFSLRELEEMESADICKVLEITETNLWVVLHRARMHLRRCLEVKWLSSATPANK